MATKINPVSCLWLADPADRSAMTSDDVRAPTLPSALRVYLEADLGGAGGAVGSAASHGVVRNVYGCDDHTRMR